MQIRKSHRILAAFLALVMVFGILPATAFARASGNDGSAEMNEAYAEKKSLMPIGPSFNVDTLLEWTPEADPDARYSRASIPLANRVGGFVVNPMVNPEAKLMLCSLANSDHDNTSAQGTESFLSWSFNYWQYAGSFVYWSGSEEGLVVVPTGEFTDAAHTNGVPVVATLGFPWGSGTGYVQQVRAFIHKNADGSFPVADKLIEVMDYYGFDGYFFNQESYGCNKDDADRIDEMMRYMHKKRPDMLISWYDAMKRDNGGVGYDNITRDAGYFDVIDGVRSVDEYFMNYNWNGNNQVNNAVTVTKNAGRSPFDAFAGLDVQQNCMKTSFPDHLLVDEDGMLRISLAMYCPNSTLGLSKDGEQFHQVEQQFYTNNAGDPRDTSVNLSSSAWAGMSRFIADRTVIMDIGEKPFVTDFNSGHGRGYYVDGELSRDAEWSYQSNQDVTPTWTWIIDSEGSKLAGAYDFSDAWNGGNSIKFSGNLDANKANDIMLFSTKVLMESGTQIGLTYKGDQGKMKLVAYYGDAFTESYEECEQVAYDLRAGDGAWTTTELKNLDKAGKILYAIGLKIESAEDVADYQVNLGRLTLMNKKLTSVNATSEVTLDEIMYKDAYTASARVYWKAATGASSYEIYKVNADGTRTLIMETPNTAFYIPTLERAADEENVTLEIVSINRYGVRGKSGTKLTIDWLYGNDAGDKVEFEYFENVCLGATVTGVSFQNDGEPASKAIDGTSANNSKWCATNKSTGYMDIDVGREVTVRRWRVEHAEYGGEANNMNTVDFALEYKNASGVWTEVKRIQNNHDAVTDILLDNPVTAQEWRLRVYDDGSSPWGGIRIYEWQMFETAVLPQSNPIPMHLVEAVNNPGATDTLTLENVLKGAVVKVYTRDGDEYTQIGEATAPMDGQVLTFTVTLEDLDFGTADAGRVYYTTTDLASTESAKLSASFEAENAEKTPAATNVHFVKFSQPGSTTSFNGDDVYTTMTVNDLQPGDVIYVYEDGAEANYTKSSLPVAPGATSVSVERVRVPQVNGTLTLRVKRNGMLLSDAYEVAVDDLGKPMATLHIYAESETGERLTGAQFNIVDDAGEIVDQIGTSSDSGGKLELPLGTYTLVNTGVPAGYDKLREPVAVELVNENEEHVYVITIPTYQDPEITGVTLNPSSATVSRGLSARFHAVVEGVGGYSDEVVWTLSGNESQETTLVDGLLTVAKDEAAETLTVTATSAVDSTKSATATVTLSDFKNVAAGSSVWAYYDGKEDLEDTMKYLYDGDPDTAWVEDSISYVTYNFDGGSFVNVYNDWVALDLGDWYDVKSVRVVDGAEDFTILSYPQTAPYVSWFENQNMHNRTANLMNEAYGITELAKVTGNTNLICDVALNATVRYLILRVDNADSIHVGELEVYADVQEPVEPEEGQFKRIVHLDAGRKFFSVENIKKVIDTMEAASFNELQYYFSDNQGFRFGLDDMTLTTEFGTYDLTPCLGDGYNDGNSGPDGTNKWLTEADVKEIIAYANERGIAVVPCFEVPGHMGAILEEFPELCYTNAYGTSKSSIDLRSDEAVAFAQGLVDKYAAWFAEQGCTTFNFGADEYANDLSGMGFEGIYKDGQMAQFVEFANEVADIIMSYDMTPRAFNDGFSYNHSTEYGTINKEVEVCYWTQGWWGYNLASANYLHKQGYKIINTHGDWYWVLGREPGGQVTPEKAATFDYKVFPSGSYIEKPFGAMFCVWCDKAFTDGPDEGAKTVEEIAPIIKAFGSTLPGYEEPEGPKPTGVTVTPNPAEVEMGGTVQFTATVTGTGDVAQDVIWSVWGNYSEDTFIDENGLLTVGEVENTNFWVTAEVAADRSIYVDVMVTAVEPTEPTDPTDPVDPDDLIALKEAAEAAAKAAKEAQAAAEAALKEAQDARDAAEDALASAAMDKEAAEKAAADAAEAQEKAEAAQAAAEAAQEAAEAAQTAAEEANKDAAQQALKAAEEAKAAAEEAAAAAKSASDAAQAQAAAQAAQEAAEAAQAKAEAAQKGAEEAREKAEEFANNADVSEEEAKKAADAAKAAEDAAAAAQTAAENAQAAAKDAADAADASNKEAAEAAAAAANYAKQVADAYAEIVKIKTELVDVLEETRLAAIEAKKAALDAAKFYALIELAHVDTKDLNHVQKAAADEILAAARQAIDEATEVADVQALLDEALADLKDLDKLACAAEAFSDVSEDDWFHEDADFMLNNGYMNGYPGGTFRPDVKVSRAQLVTILYRVAGEPEVEGAADFSDVAEDYYTNAVIWAAEQGITTGYPDGTFRPNAEVSRQELVTFLYRFAEAEAVEEDHLTQFPDAGKVADYAVESMNWAIANGIVSGAVRDNVLVIAPEDTARRDETCAIVARYMNAN